MLPQKAPLPARHGAQLIASNVSVIRGGTPVLKHLDLTVTATSRVAVVGENGRGKSTLVHVLTGALVPDSGTVQQIGTLGIAEQEMPAGDDRTVGQAVSEAIAAPLAALADLDTAALALSARDAGAEERYADALEHAEALDAWDAERRVQIALEALDAETDLSRRLQDLSVGQRYRVRLACLLGADDDFLLLDEPTNHLDQNGLEFLTAQLRARNGGVVVVTHDRALLSDVAETIVDLDPTPDGRVRVYGNGYAGYRDGRQAEQERWQQEFDRQQTEFARLQDSLSSAQNRLVSGWRPEKGTNKHGRATRAGGLVQSVRRRQEQLEAHAVTVPEPPQQLRFPDLETRTGATLLSVDEVTVAGRLTRSVTFSLSHRGRLVVTGPNGAGKSTLLSVVAGDVHPDTGSVRRPTNVRLGFLRQESTLPLNRRANEVYTTHVDALVSAGIVPPSETIGLSQLGLLRARESSKRVAELSMGQQRRLDLALVLAAKPHVLLLDEPTNHLSIALVDELTDALRATEAAVIVSSHDRQLLRDVNDWPAMALAAPTGSEARA
ncbi:MULTISPECIES: ABC-F family ATP-binding cassette domain-containing protein [unclassified Gordonia (in: high G+C Gram-positive bacteria)]|uniref:ABC-F family ATP-binding cassette domain-containing protein n=1 Tax=unclassified Gordonia (in: high G+C Gram-positive bacteria) TaxID=2657482 RepID=UPI00071D5F3D|nr:MULTISPECIES: ABC-F family ATP-binding cassette domain-containing protein [unclassified Gordonia (in: high G+C Gram-positive bacteria)]KSU55608.1 ABC transporter [Gordonia sp. SGD-V-85]SCC51062.1 macrolide transport system ATP-binding/permease protein [Gordonia sp. v-85]